MLLVVLTAANIFNVVDAARKCVFAAANPATISSVQTVDAFQMKVAFCLPLDIQGDPLRNASLTLTGIVFGEAGANATELASTSTPDPDMQNFLLTKNYGIACLTLDLTETLAWSAGTSVVVQVRGTSTQPDLAYLFVWDASVSPLPKSQNVQIVSSTFVYQAALSMKLKYSTDNKLASRDILVSLSTQAVNLAEANQSVFQTDVFMSTARTNFEASVTREFISYDAVDFLSAVFAWASVSLAIFRFLFPMLPYSRRSRFFICGSGPDSARSDDGATSSADGEHSTGTKLA